MPVKPPDFKASGVRVERIIASGSNKNPRLLLIGSGSTNSNGINVNTDTLRLSGTGSDTWIFISGSTGITDRITLGGNTFLSGSLFGHNLKLSGSSTSIQTDSVHGGTDVNFFVEGSPGAKDTTVRGVSVLNGDLVVSGTIYDGLGYAYSVGGGGGGSVGGSNTNVQYNYSGSFAGSPTFYYDFDYNVLTLPSTRITDRVELLNGTAVITGTLDVNGTTMLSGSTYIGDGIANDYLYVNALLATDIIPDGDRSRNLGSSTARFANIYTGDLHLKNERGDWTVIEEIDYLTVTNNKTGKRFKIVMEPID
jgi:hypothetical protein